MLNYDRTVLGVPLFHGTSSLFLPSIKQFGLGAVNPIMDYKVMEFFQHIYEIGKLIFTQDEQAILGFYIYHKMLNQEISDGGYNFRYGNIYLAADIERAKGYSFDNKYGSELLSSAIELYEKIVEKDPSIAMDPIILNSPISQLIYSEYKHKPIVLEVNNVELKYLRTEKGNPIEDTTLRKI